MYTFLSFGLNSFSGFVGILGSLSVAYGGMFYICRNTTRYHYPGPTSPRCNAVLANGIMKKMWSSVKAVLGTKQYIMKHLHVEILFAPPARRIYIHKHTFQNIFLLIFARASGATILGTHRHQSTLLFWHLQRGDLRFTAISFQNMSCYVLGEAVLATQRCFGSNMF